MTLRKLFQQSRCGDLLRGNTLLILLSDFP
jgi:hypothetical protein